MKVDAPHVVSSGVPQATVVVAPQPQATPAKTAAGCDCTIPPDAPQEVKQVRILAIVVIAVHVLALLVLGFWNWSQWVGSLCGIIAAAVMLCCYQKTCYTCTPATWIVALIFDLIGAILWFSVPGYEWVGIFSIIALIATIPAVVFGFKACSGWVHPIDSTRGPVVAVHESRPAPTATVSHMPQRAPPAYGSSV